MLALPAAPITRMLIGWDVGVLIYLVAAAIVMSHCISVAQMKHNAAAQDEGGFAILILTVAAAMASLVAIFAELATVERTDPHYGTLRHARASAPWCCRGPSSTPSSPCTMRTISTAPVSTRTACGFPATASRTTGTSSILPSSIGMTFQVSDVAVTHKSVRRTVVAHGALSFFFTTAVVAMAVNIAASIIQK